MRLFHSLLALVLLRLSVRLMNRSNALQARAIRHLETSKAIGAQSLCRDKLPPSGNCERFLLASIVGVGIAGLWLGICWRAV